MLLSTLSASLLGNMLAGIGAIQMGKWTIRAFRIFNAVSYGLTNFVKKRYCENEPRFNAVYSRNNLSKRKVGAYVIYLDEYESIGTHWIALYVNSKNVTYFDRFGVERIPKEIKRFIRNQNITTHINRI